MSSFQQTRRQHWVRTYTPPVWATTTTCIPKEAIPSTYVHLRVSEQTPIEPMIDASMTPSVSLCEAVQKNNVSLSVKRDDLTEGAMCGNKLRKLEFLLAYAIDNKYDSVATIGGWQSNHCRTTALAANRLGLPVHLLLRTNGDVKPTELQPDGNVLLDRLSGANIHLLSRERYTQLGGAGEVLDLFLAERLKQGEKVYRCPMGGSNGLGLWGYIECFAELERQLKATDSHIDDLFVAVGSGGTVAGLALAAYMSGSHIKVHGVCVCDDTAVFTAEIDRMLRDLGVDDSVCTGDIVDLIEGYQGLGYGITTADQWSVMQQLSRETGLMFDGTYGLKGIIGTLTELSKPQYNGHKAMFIHTGGLPSLWQNQITSALSEFFPTSEISPLGL